MSIIGGNPALGDAAGDEGLELLGDGRVDRGWLVRGEELLPDPVRLRWQLGRASFLPRLVVAPIAEHRLVERRAVTRLGVLGAEEVAAWTDLLHRGEGWRRLVDDHGLQERLD